MFALQAFGSYASHALPLVGAASPSDSLASQSSAKLIDLFLDFLRFCFQFEQHFFEYQPFGPRHLAKFLSGANQR
jgi:hypothetical protein